jgi:thiol-disulfide isomerase/thioredoxin
MADEVARPDVPPAPPRKPLLPWPAWVVVILLAAGLVYQGAIDAERAALLAGGSAAPAFALERYGGSTVRLEELHGKVVLLDFWATWCRPCQADMPSLVRLAKEYESRGLVFVAGSRDDESSAKAAVGVYIARHLPQLEPYAAFADDVTASQYRVQTLPTMYLIDKNGKVADSASGVLSESSLRRRIERVLAQ